MGPQPVRKVMCAQDQANIKQASSRAPCPKYHAPDVVGQNSGSGRRWAGRGRRGLLLTLAFQLSRLWRMRALDRLPFCFCGIPDVCSLCLLSLALPLPLLSLQA